MANLYGNIIVDISHENLDKTYEYAIPDQLINTVVIGSQVLIPFGRGNRLIKGYILSFSIIPKYNIDLIKPIHSVINDAIVIETHLIQLAYWIKDNFGATMNDALRTVIPIKNTVKAKEEKSIKLKILQEEANSLVEVYRKKNYKAKVRLLEELIVKDRISYDIATKKLSIPRSTVLSMIKDNIIEETSKKVYRNPVKTMDLGEYDLELTKEQRKITDDFKKEYEEGIRKTYLIHGITGSGKTEVYMEMIDQIIRQKKQVIMLIPEIALTHQTVMRFYKRFKDRISIMNSRLSQGERYDQYLRAKNGDIDIMIGPRSALFTPFNNLGLIIIDEEHEGSYKSEMPPKYHGRDVAIKRAQLLNASVVLGSATPSLETYQKAESGEYKLYKLNNRAKSAVLPEVYIADLREELKEMNKSIFSRQLKSLIKDRIEKKQQIMLFINRRGYAGFVSCRSCGHVMKCPHCDVSLTSHNNGKILCHYCGYEKPLPKTCPVCESKYIATFGTGTQKVEELAKKEFPGVKVLRMDTDTTSTKDSHEKILTAFANKEADILVGTQMIVKGHDFPSVTLVGIIAADLSLYANDYRASERTFQLLTQAAGRAGRGADKGEVVIQTYNPEHYSVITASTGDYESFYKQEIAYRSLMKYPPIANILVILISSRQEEKGEKAASLLSGAIKEETNKLKDFVEEEITIIGPTKASLSKANDIYRHIIYLKHSDYNYLKQLKNYLEGYIEFSEFFKSCNVQFDFNPMTSY